MGIRKSDPFDIHFNNQLALSPELQQFHSASRFVTPGPLGVPNENSHLSNLRTAPHFELPIPCETQLEEFKRRLIERQVWKRESQGKKAILELDDSELDFIAGSKALQMRKDVAVLFNKMWNEITQNFKNRKNALPKDTIGVQSAYRSADKDRKAWNKAMPKYIAATQERRLATGFEFGSIAVHIMYEHMNGLKAPPGFSGHTQGIAADLTTHEDGKTWEINSDPDHQVGWQKTWLYKWLVDNAWKHDFYQLKTETWHWEYHKDGPSDQCWGGQVTHRPVVKR